MTFYSLCAIALALSQSSTFEVAAIRPAPDNRTPGLSMERLITMAYRIKPYQLVGPEWMHSQKFSVSVKAPDGASPTQFPEMWQSLLAERFQLRVHRETRRLTIYALVVDKKGHRLKAPKEPPKKADNDEPDEGGDGCSNPAGHLDCDRATMVDLAAYLTAIRTTGIDLPVVDRTGLMGKYSFALRWAAPRTGRGMAPDSAASPDESIFDSLAAYGLKLERRREPTEVIVVDRLERTPSEN